jgi:hypothetical protein
MSTLAKDEDFCGYQPPSAPKVLNSTRKVVFGRDEHLRPDGGEAAAPAAPDEPAGWRAGFARLNPDRPPGDVPPRRWRQFIEDARAFLAGDFAAAAVALGWTALDLFGCDRDRPFARIDRAGLIWLLHGDRLVALGADGAATIETRTGARHTFRHRRDHYPGRVLAWELEQ